MREWWDLEVCPHCCSLVELHILNGDNKEVMIAQIMDPSLQDNEDDELGGSMPSSIFSDKSPEEKQVCLPAAETEWREKG